MPSNKDFDEILKNKFENFETPLPNGGWNNIKDRIPERRKKRFLLMPLMMAASVLMTILSGYFFIKSNDSAPNVQSNEQNIKSNANHTSAQENVIALNNQSTQNEVEKFDNTIYNQSIENTESASSDKLGNNISSLNNTSTSNYEITNENGNNGGKTITPLIASNIISNTTPNEISNTKIESNNLNNASGEIVDINMMPLMGINLLAVNGRNPKLTEAILVEEETPSSLSAVEEGKEEEEKVNKLHFGVTAAPVYASKRMVANTEDNVNISQYKGLNEFNKRRTGYSVGVVSNYDLSPKLSIIGGLNCTNLSDENTYIVTEKTEKQELKKVTNNSYSFSTTKETEKTTTSVLHYIELETGMKYLLLENKGIYIKGTAGLSKLLYSKSSERDEFNNVNYNTAIAIGREYKVGNFKICIEPEVTYYLKAYQNDGEVMAKPTTFGINFIATR